jgi:hypothetical protein
VIPIPDPSRLVPPRLPVYSSAGRHSFAVGLLALASFPVLLAFAIGAGALGAALSPWLAIPAGIIGLSIGMGLTQGPIVLCGVFEAIFYAAVAFVFTGGLETHNRDSSTILAAIVAAILLGLTYTARNDG